MSTPGGSACLLHPVTQPCPASSPCLSHSDSHLSTGTSLWVQDDGRVAHEGRVAESSLRPSVYLEACGRKWGHSRWKWKGHGGGHVSTMTGSLLLAPTQSPPASIVTRGCRCGHLTADGKGKSFSAFSAKCCQQCYLNCVGEIRPLMKVWTLNTVSRVTRRCSLICLHQSVCPQNWEECFTFGCHDYF